MPVSQNNDVPVELLKSVESLMLLMQNLLCDIKEHSTSLALVKIRLESLTKNVETLSNIVRDGNGKGSMITRLALAEKAIEDMEESFDELKKEISKNVDELKDCIKKEHEDEHRNEEQEKAFRREKLLAKLKIVAVAAPGVLALILVLLKMVFGTDVVE